MAEPDLSSKVDELKVAENAAEADDDDQIIDPWQVVTKSDKGVDYDKLISKLEIEMLFQ